MLRLDFVICIYRLQITQRASSIYTNFAEFGTRRTWQKKGDGKRKGLFFKRVFEIPAPYYEHNLIECGAHLGDLFFQVRGFCRTR